MQLKEESEKAFKELNLMKNLKSFCYRIEHIDSEIEKKTLKFDEYSETNHSSDISLSHPVFDPRRPVLLHIQMEFCCQTMNEVMSYLSNEFIENNSKNDENIVLLYLLWIIDWNYRMC